MSSCQKIGLVYNGASVHLGLCTKLAPHTCVRVCRSSRRVRECHVCGTCARFCASHHSFATLDIFIPLARRRPFTHMAVLGLHFSIRSLCSSAVMELCRYAACAVLTLWSSAAMQFSRFAVLPLCSLRSSAWLHAVSCWVFPGRRLCVRDVSAICPHPLFLSGFAP